MGTGFLEAELGQACVAVAMLRLRYEKGDDGLSGISSAFIMALACAQDVLQQGRTQGTWQLLAAEEDDEQLKLAGQVTMRFAWRSALA